MSTLCPRKFTTIGVALYGKGSFVPFVNRLQRLEHLAAKFDHKASNIEKWAADHPEKLSRNDDIEAANLAEATVSLNPLCVQLCSCTHIRAVAGACVLFVYLYLYF